MSSTAFVCEYYHTLCLLLHVCVTITILCVVYILCLSPIYFYILCLYTAFVCGYYHTLCLLCTAFVCEYYHTLCLLYTALCVNIIMLCKSTQSMVCVDCSLKHGFILCAVQLADYINPCFIFNILYMLYIQHNKYICFTFNIISIYALHLT